VGILAVSAREADRKTNALRQVGRGREAAKEADRQAMQARSLDNGGRSRQAGR
jgi:hypothetical protein